MAGIKGRSGVRRVFRLAPDTPSGASAQEILRLAAPEAAEYLRRVANGELKSRQEWGRIDVCKFVVSEALRREAAQGLLDAGGNRIYSYKMLILMAQQFMPPSAKSALDGQGGASEGLPKELLGESPATP